jgi:DNA helicase-2/ATP-dependent DNA helicase PcrA
MEKESKFTLDKSQELFCASKSPNIRLLAPAGCGKTYSLLWRCLYLFKSSTKKKPHFLIVTFTKVAADVLKDRLKKDPNFLPIQSQVKIFTLNSYGYNYLKNRHKNIQLLESDEKRNNFILFDLRSIWEEYPALNKTLTDTRLKNRAAKSTMDILDHLKLLGFRHDVHKSKQKVMEHIAWLRKNGLELHFDKILNELIDLEIIKKQSIDKTKKQSIDQTKNQLIDQFYNNYYLFWLKACELMFLLKKSTFEDQKYWMVLILEKDFKQNKVTRGFDYILVDEFQDINLLDLNLIKLITDSSKGKLTIVGDDDQAIYEWRFASPKFIREPSTFLKTNFETYILETNYRSPKNIVDLSQKLIKNNKFRVDKQIRAQSIINAEINAYLMSDLKASLNYILEYVRSNIQKNDQTIAIIGRKRSQIIPYQIVFTSQNIPFYAAEDLNIFLSTAFNELKEILLFSLNYETKRSDVVNDTLKLCDYVFHYPIKKEERIPLKKYLLELKPQTLAEAVKGLFYYDGPIKGVTSNGEKCSENIQSVLQAKTVSDCIYAISKNFDRFSKDYGKSLDDVFYADPPFLYLGEYASQYGNNFEKFYADIELAASQLQFDPNHTEESPNNQKWKLPLHLMTAYRTKGKEFDTIFILDCNDGMWPHKLAETPEDLEQERRLFYVAFTRARQRVFILSNQKILGNVTLPSRYIHEMGLNLVKK